MNGRAGEGRRPADEEGDGFVNRAGPRPRDPVLQEAVTDVIGDDIGGEEADARLPRLREKEKEDSKENPQFALGAGQVIEDLYIGGRLIRKYN